MSVRQSAKNACPSTWLVSMRYPDVLGTTRLVETAKSSGERTKIIAARNVWSADTNESMRTVRPPTVSGYVASSTPSDTCEPSPQHEAYRPICGGFEQHLPDGPPGRNVEDTDGLAEQHPVHACVIESRVGRRQRGRD